MKQKGFTLIELLVVIAIIGILSSMVLVNINTSRDKASLAKVKSFAHQVDHALGAYTVIAYDFDEGIGNTLYDLSGYGNDLTPVGSLNGVWVEGIKGNAFQFNGSNNFQFPSSSIGKAATFSFWFRLVDLDGEDNGAGTFLCVDDTPDESGTIEDNLGFNFGGFGDERCGSGNSNDIISTTLKVEDNEWHHFLLSKSAEAKLCLDSECEVIPRGSGDWLNTVLDIRRIEFNTGCGCGFGNFSTGLVIDNLRIYEEPLSSVQLEKIYAELYGDYKLTKNNK